MEGGPFRIVITGGPCAGKSRVWRFLGEAFQGGVQVPEAATQLILDGKQTGDGHTAWLNVTPFAASRSMCGVCAWGCPLRTPFQSFQSSTLTNRRLGRSSGVASLRCA